MKENLALLLAILYLIYRFKTYKKTNKIIEDRIENVHKPYFKRIRDVLGCSEEEAEKVGLASVSYTHLDVYKRQAPTGEVSL